MRENSTYGSMRGWAYPITRGVPLYSTPSESLAGTVRFERRNRAAAPRTGAAVGCEVSRVGRSTVYNRTRDAPVSRNGLALCYNGFIKNEHVVYET